VTYSFTTVSNGKEVFFLLFPLELPKHPPEVQRKAPRVLENILNPPLPISLYRGINFLHTLIIESGG
jgi:hypothetical protein